MTIALKNHINKVISLTDDEYTFVLSHFTEREAKKGDLLIRKGELVPHAFFVVSGLLKLIHIDDEGKEYIVSFAMEDWWESDFLAFYSNSKATMSLQCIEHTRVYCLTLKNYKSLCTGLQKMEHFFLEKANRGYIGSQQRIISLITHSAQERYEHLLKRYPTLFQRVSKSQLASYLGVSRETLSRLYK